MKKFLNLLKKDIRELITVELLLPLIIMIVLLNVVGNIVSTETKKASVPQDVLVVNLDQGSYSELVLETLRKGSFNVHESDAITIDEAVQAAYSNKQKVIVQIPQEFSKNLLDMKQPEIKIYSVFTGFSVTQLSQPAIVKSIFEYLTQNISREFISREITGVDPSVIQQPIALADYSVVNGKVAKVSPEVVAQAFSSRFFFIPIILVIVIVFSAQMLASLVAMEKQNKTLETLLTVPVQRHYIVLSKMLSAGLVALIISAVYMYGFTGYMQGITGGQMSINNPQASLALKELGLNFTRFHLVMLGTSLFFAILAALAIATLLAVYAQDVKDANALLTPLMVLLMLPYFLTLFTDPNSLPFSLKAFLYAIPFAHPFLAVQNLLFGRTMYVAYGIIYEVIFSIVCVIVATRIFSSDRILTAKVRFKGLKLRR